MENAFFVNVKNKKREKPVEIKIFATMPQGIKTSLLKGFMK